ncbi:MAG TPA: hypothetical protein VFP83_05890 [Candidatus Limnocylindria bacterium]|nr:hypothetical protein [Candidatus Limnocylindria bacterium]
MSRGRPRHHVSRRRAYSSRQREVRERRLRIEREPADWDAIEEEPVADEPQPAWTLRMQGRPAAA